MNHYQTFLKETDSEIDKFVLGEYNEEVAGMIRSRIKSISRARLAALMELVIEKMEGMKYKDVRDTSDNVADDPDYEAEHQTSWNAALSYLAQTLKEEIKTAV